MARRPKDPQAAERMAELAIFLRSLLRPVVGVAIVVVAVLAIGGALGR